MNLNKFDMTLDEAIAVIKEISPEDESTSSGVAEARVLNAVHNGELVEWHDACDKIRDVMTSLIDPMSKDIDNVPRGAFYRRWVELWWMLDHYFEQELPKWGEEDE